MKQMMDAYQAWRKKPSPQAASAFVRAARPVIDMAVRSYVGYSDPVAYSQAKLLALKAMKSYDPRKNTQLRTHMLTQMQPLRRLSAKRRFVAHIPERVQYDMSGLKEAQAELTNELGRDPTDIELADKSGMSLKRIKHMRKFSVSTPESTMDLDKGIVTDERGPMDEWQDYVYYDLSPTDKKIYEWRTGYNGNKVLGVGEIAKKLNLSSGRVTQRANDIAMKLEEGLSLGKPRS